MIGSAPGGVLSAPCAKAATKSAAIRPHADMIECPPEPFTKGHDARTQNFSCFERKRDSGHLPCRSDRGVNPTFYPAWAFSLDPSKDVGGRESCDCDQPQKM